MDNLNTDLLILGSGAAGIRAAHSASKQGARIIIVNPENMTHSGSTFSPFSKGWGIQALMDQERSEKELEEFYEEIIHVGLDQCNPELVRILTEESGRRVEDLIQFGIQFIKNQNGEYQRAKGCFSTKKRALLTQDFRNIKKTFIRIFHKTQAKMIKGFVLDLIVSDHQCMGGFVLTDADEILKITAKSTILATGGGAGVYENHMADEHGSGDGYALASRAGAELINMEFIQFMLGLKHHNRKSFLPLHELKRPKMIVDESGTDILDLKFENQANQSMAVDDRLKHYPFSCRDRSYHIDLAVDEIYQKGGKVFWLGLNQFKSKPEVVHFAHAFNGGVKINENSETTVPGLYAAGEVAAGPHGADRMGGCMMTATQVFGKRAGNSAGKHARDMGESFTSPSSHELPEEKVLNKYPWKMNQNCPLLFSEVAQRIGQAMGRYVGVMRDNEGLKTCQSVLEESEKKILSMKQEGKFDLNGFYKVRNIITTCKLITKSAIKRKECKGSHFRIDHWGSFNHSE